MSRRDLGLLGIGLIIGLLLGTVVVGSSSDLRSSLFGTVGLTPNAEPAYVLVNMEQTRALLEETYPDEREQIDAALTQVDRLRTDMDFASAVRETEADVDYVVSRTYTALTGEHDEDAQVQPPQVLPTPLLPSVADGDVQSCLSIDENPYNIEGFTLYFYLQVPSTQVNALPGAWERLDEAKDDDLYWQRLACQSLVEVESRGGSR